MGVVVFGVKQPPSVMTQAEMFPNEVVFLKFSSSYAESRLPVPRLYFWIYLGLNIVVNIWDNVSTQPNKNT